MKKMMNEIVLEKILWGVLCLLVGIGGYILGRMSGEARVRKQVNDAIAELEHQQAQQQYDNSQQETMVEDPTEQPTGFSGFNQPTQKPRVIGTGELLEVYTDDIPAEAEEEQEKEVEFINPDDQLTEEEQQMQEAPKRSQGRPVGSKGKTKIHRERGWNLKKANRKV